MHRGYRAVDFVCVGRSSCTVVAQWLTAWHWLCYRSAGLLSSGINLYSCHLQDKCKVGQTMEMDVLRPQSKEKLAILLEAAPPPPMPTMAIIIKQ